MPRGYHSPFRAWHWQDKHNTECQHRYCSDCEKGKPLAKISFPNVIQYGKRLPRRLKKLRKLMDEIYFPNECSCRRLYQKTWDGKSWGGFDHEGKCLNWLIDCRDPSKRWYPCKGPNSVFRFWPQKGPYPSYYLFNGEVYS